MKFYGKVGFWLGDVEEVPGVYVPNIKEVEYVGDILKNTRQFQSANDQQNDNLVLNSRVSIISDLYLRENYSSVRYVEIFDVRWKVKYVDINNYPRIEFQLGEVYNGEKPN